MPVILRHKGYRFFFFSNEGNPLEPLHVHVREGEKIAKLWLEPEIRLAENYGFSTTQLREIWDVVTAQRSFITEKWHEFFGN